MIIKSSRILAHHGSKIAHYFGDQGENELVSWALGDAADIELMSLIARYSGKLFGVRHIVIAPESDVPFSAVQTVVGEIFEEYEVSNLCRNQACLVMHQKTRSGAGGSDKHFHLAIPEFDPVSRRVLSSRYTKMRDEKLARILELKLGHRPIVGRHNRLVLEAIEREDPDLDSQPFVDALKSAALDQGLPDDQWRDVKARATPWRRQSDSSLHEPNQPPIPTFGI
ncbi:hypothetical protein [Shimia thalassica]|uniref:hypothetical protein n=1 Tax=Shimia thalassica TaxID=1715693 RepID=UPI0026E12C10|nr:hypothetical protein [Shimia thalassica]MDO6481875.1 hypothetical protein [Shimia thalassica]